MPLSRPGTAKTRALIAVLVASAILSPFAARAALANHDLQRIDLHHCAMKHDRAFGPVAAAEHLVNPGLN